jgi:uracil-DNA glycosylase
MLKLPNNDWQVQLSDFFSTDTFSSLQNFLEEEYQQQIIYPPENEVFNAFTLTPFNQVRVLILGQDPYHGPGQAHGLAFSVKSPCKPPPSLKNIFKELALTSTEGDLTSWAEQGVFLLNTVLTVRKADPNSHSKMGWEDFTDGVIKTLSDKKEKMIFVLWGAPAQKKKKLIDSEKHIILESPHPSPLSAYRGFFGCGHFEEINKLLKQDKKPEIDWHLDDGALTQPELF